MEVLSTTSSRYAHKKEKRKLKNHSVTVFCFQGHFLEGFTLNRVLAEHPELHAVANSRVCLKKHTDACKVCMSARKAELRKESKRIRHLYREDQQTRVTVHNVRYFCADGSVATASFHGKVKKVAIDKDTAKGFIGILLRPRDDLRFSDMTAFEDHNVRVERESLFLRKDNKGVAFVHVFPMHLQSDSKVVRLGSRCKEEKCAAANCADHTLLPLKE